MKRLRSSDDLEESNSNRSSSHRNFYYNKPDNGRKGPSVSSSRFDRPAEEDRESSRVLRKRPEYDFEGFDRRKGFDRFKDGGGGGGDKGGISSSSPRGASYGVERIHRSESFSGPRREFPKGFRSERDRSRREGSVSSWRRFGTLKEFNESGRNDNDVARGSRVRSPKGLRESNLKSPTLSKESGSEQSKLRSPKGYRDASPKGFRDASPKGFRDASPKGFRDASPKGFRDVKLKSPAWSKESGSEQSKLRSPNGFRDIKSKSPTWSKESGSEQSRMMSPRGLRDAKSPPWSKDSGSEQSKSFEVKKNDKSQIENDGSSEMEEGELEPEPDAEAPAHEPVIETEVQSRSEVAPEPKEVACNPLNEDAQSNTDHAEKSPCQEAIEPTKERIHEKEIVEEEISDMPNGEKDSHEGSGSGEQIRTTPDHEVGKEEHGFKEVGNYRDYEADFSGHTIVESLPRPRGQLMELEDRGINAKVKAEHIDLTEPNKEVTQENQAPEMIWAFTNVGLSQDYKDKGKSVAVSSLHVADSAEDDVLIERESRDLLSLRDKDNNMEGPSNRGFELFSSLPFKRSDRTDLSLINKQKDEKMELESLNLSLSLPNVLLPIGSRDATQAPGSPSQTRSVQSLTNTFLTNSDGFTPSMSFSGSQTFMHNPSCSLTQNSFDNFEQSVGSHPIFQGIDQVMSDSKHKEVPYQRILQSQSLSSKQNGQELHGNHHRILKGSTKLPIRMDRQLSFQNQFSGVQLHPDNDLQAPTQSAGSHRIASEYSNDKRRITKEKSSSSLYKSDSLKERLLAGGPDFAETIISRIVSEPLHVMARKFNEMTEQFIQCLKETVCEIMFKEDKHNQLCAYQKVLQNRTDTTLDMLMKSHRSQLEILVALKTGIKEFLRRNNNTSTSDLAEIFLNLRCRNISCRSILPVDGCDCKFCSKKKGFCSACMCLICSKFDTASNTCSWVGCDVCQHWCHTDCALRDSYIRCGGSTTGVEGPSEMQFHCVACAHPSEMFGFVKEVFQNFAKDWSAEALSKELEYVKRIFYASMDLRGKQLHDSIDQMQARLANKSNLPEIYNHIMGILTGKESSNLGNTLVFSRKDLPNKNHQAEGSNGFGGGSLHKNHQAEGSNGVGGVSLQQDIWLKPIYQERPLQLDRSASYHESQVRTPQLDRSASYSESQRSIPKEPVFDELDSIVRMKHAEAKMFQARADDAKREAESLKRIAIAKNEKAEEEYSSRIAKLHLAEAEELHKQKLEELQVLERAHREYFNMKVRMEADIKDLLLKMEATRRNLAK